MGSRRGKKAIRDELASEERWSRLFETGDQNLLTPHIIVKISVTKLEHFKNVLPCGKEERKQKHKHKLVGQDECPRVSTQVVYTFSFPMCDCLTYPIYRTK